MQRCKEEKKLRQNEIGREMRNRKREDIRNNAVLLFKSEFQFTEVVTPLKTDRCIVVPENSKYSLMIISVTCSTEANDTLIHF